MSPLAQVWLAHLPVLPIVVPLMAGAALLVPALATPQRSRAVVWASLAVLAAVAVTALLRTADGHPGVYLLGNWPAPFGIVLVIDKLTAIMLALVAVIGGAAFAASGGMKTPAHDWFAPLFLFQLAGLNGAFLTADLFNLFVFFEVLLAASYGLLLQQADRARVGAATHYVVINLVGSALFLIAVSLIYGVTGTLNMADLSQRLGAVSPHARGLVAAAGALLVVVFAIKAALLPLNFWLTRTYSAAVFPVAALFALMTKVGVVAIFRTLTQLYPIEGDINRAISSVLMWVGPLTLFVGALGALAARTLPVLIGWSVVSSAGLMVTALALGTPRALSGAMFYLIGSTVATALLFLLAATIDASRAKHVEAGSASSSRWAIVGTLFAIGVVAIAGLPPLAGFIGKATVLAGATSHAQGGMVIAVVLTGGLMSLIAYARMGSQLFWKRSAVIENDPATQSVIVPALVLASLLGLLSVFAAPVQRFSDQAAIELQRPQLAAGNVLTKRPLAKDTPAIGAPRSGATP
jgi:multicomponent K+:H+ antiporter subunit D